MQRGPLRQRVEARPSGLTYATLLALVCGAVSAAGVGAAEPSAGARLSAVSAPEAAPRRDLLSLDEAIDRAQKRFRARVVRAEQSQQGGRVVYVLRLLSDEDGRVFTVRVDAETGEMQ